MMESQKQPFFFDAHNDSVILRHARGDPIDLAICDVSYDVDLPRLRAGSTGAVFVMVGDHSLPVSVALIDGVQRMAEAHPDDFELCCSRRQAKGAINAGRIALFMSIESQAMFDEDLSALRVWHDLGVRMASISHGEGKFRDNPVALQYDAACNEWLDTHARRQLRRREKGLTPFAKESLHEMGRLGMILDLSHANDAAFWMALEIYEGPVCCSHSNCFTLCQQGRNLTDEMLRALAERNGFVGICPYERFVSDQHPDIGKLVDHIIHAVDVMGEDRVGMAGDFDGIPLHHRMVIEHPGRMPDLWKELAGRGLGDTIIAGIAGENLLHFIP